MATVGSSGDFGFVPLTTPVRYQSAPAGGAINRGALLIMNTGNVTARPDASTTAPVGVALNSGDLNDTIIYCADQNQLYEVRTDLTPLAIAASTGNYFAHVGNTVANAAGNAASVIIDGTSGVAAPTTNKVVQLIGASGDVGNDTAASEYKVKVRIVNFAQNA